MGGLITIMTDFGQKDPYVGVMKGVIKGINPDVSIVDLSHEIPPQDVLSAGFLLFTAYKYFPEGTVHVVVVDPGVGGSRKILACRARGGIFVVPDNGVITFIANKEGLDEIYSVENEEYFLHPVSRTFHARDIFAPVAAHLALGVEMKKLGRRVRAEDIVHLEDAFTVRHYNGNVRGKIIWVDHFGNLITNISQEVVRKNNLKAVKIGSLVIPIVEKYCDVEKGELVAVIGGTGFLEVAVNFGSARDKLGVGVGEVVEASSEVL